jgi:octaprenyl-diphosphate synthase
MLDLFAGLTSDLAEVESVMVRSLASDEPRVNALIEELGNFHGKMLRPTLLMMVATTLGEIGADHHRLGAALEMIHTATLIHDDMIDDADTRRGQPTPHVRYGANVAVLLGDYFYTHAFSLVADMESWVLQHLTGTTNLICRGELHQMCVRRDLDLDEEEYNRIIYAKTAALCELAGELGALYGSDAQRAAAANFGKLCGMAFQIVDDCLDFTGDAQKVGKTLATDIERGRLTLPILRLMRRIDPRERDAFGKRLLQVATAEDIAAIRKAVVDGGGVEDALKTARSYVDQAKRELEALPKGPERARLAELADFIVSRDF